MGRRSRGPCPFSGSSVKLLTLTLTLALLCPNLFGQQKAAAYKPPAYQVLRQNEDWSSLAKKRAGEKDSFFDSIKHVRLNGSGSVWMSFGGQWRERLENWNQFNFGAPAKAVHNDSFLLSRLLVHADLHLGEHLRVFAQGKNSFSTRRDLPGGRRTLDVDELDLQNGFVDFSFPLSGDDKFTVRSGRQELLFGKQRVVGPVDWSNTRRSFDGFSGILKVRAWEFSGFWTRPVVVRKYDFNRNDPHTQFYGIHVSGKLPASKSLLELYWLKLDTLKSNFNGTSGSERRHTLGGRLGGKLGKTNFDYDLEGAYQFGRLGVADISAFMVANQLGYTLPRVRTGPRLYVGYDYASGDSRARGDVGTYNQLFPTGHLYFGYIDALGRQNIIDLSGGASFKPTPRLTAALDVHNFWRADVHDAIYNTGGAVVRPGSAGTSRQVGRELDVTAKYQFDRHTLAEVGFNHFFPGDFIRQSGPGQSIDFVYLGLQFTF